MSARIRGWTPKGRVDAPLSEDLKIGAAGQNDIVVAAEGVSRSHARIVRSQGVYFIEDAESRNGTWVNGARVTRARLRHLDVVSLARSVDLVFIDRDNASAGPGDDQIVQLEWEGGAKAGRTYEVPIGTVTLGRGEDCEVAMNSGAVSRRHARIVNDGVSVTIEDLESANGTQVNGRKLQAPAVLQDADTIEIGDSRLRVRMRSVSKPVPVQKAEPPMQVAPPPKPEPVVPTKPVVAPAPEPVPDLPEPDQEWRTRILWPGDLAGEIFAPKLNPPAPAPEPVAPVQVPVVAAPTVPPVPPAQPTMYAGRMEGIVLPPLQQTPSREQPEPGPKTVFAAPGELFVPSALAKPVEEQAPKTMFARPEDLVVPNAIGKPVEPPASKTVFARPEDLVVPTALGKNDAPPAGGTMVELPPLAIPASVLDAAASIGLPTIRTVSSSWTMRLTGVRLTGAPGTFTLPLGESSIGRAPESTIPVTSRDISRLHATITVTPDEATVQDKGSTNGTAVNGTPQPGACKLQNGDRVKFGDTEFGVELLSEGSQ
jgi:pSer/pThr/pTyr-binding forkhead associated (FHA) protein